MQVIDFNKYINFTAIDFETANPSPTSICQIGLVRIENGEVVHKIDQLVQPPNNEYNFYNTRVHGIKAEDTIAQPTFDQVWHLMEPYITGQHVVAHNIKFDSTCLSRTLHYYQIEIPTYTKHCTVKIYKRNLALLSERYGIPLTHHNALSDAFACAMLFKKYLLESATNSFKL